MPSIASLAEEFLSAVMSGGERTTARGLLNLLGVRPSSGAISTVNDLLSSAGVRGANLRASDLEPLLESAGIQPVSLRPTRGLTDAAGITFPRRRSSRRGAGGRGRGGLGRRTQADMPPDEPLGPWQQPPEPEEPEQSVQPWIENAIPTPQSSNVYSFAYDPQTSTLYVTFKGVKLHEDNIKKSAGRLGAGQGKHQFKGKRGGTLAGKTDMPGATYAYLDVPARVFTRMKYANSKGKFVWDELRVRGTIYGARYRYQLVQGALIQQGSMHGIYVPRRATRKGFRVRTEASLGTGRRGYASSTLPSQVGFSTRRRR